MSRSYSTPTTHQPSQASTFLFIGAICGASVLSVLLDTFPPSSLPPQQPPPPSLIVREPTPTQTIPLIPTSTQSEPTLGPAAGLATCTVVTIVTMVLLLNKGRSLSYSRPPLPPRSRVVVKRRAPVLEHWDEDESSEDEADKEVDTTEGGTPSPYSTPVSTITTKDLLKKQSSSFLLRAFSLFVILSSAYFLVTFWTEVSHLAHDIWVVTLRVSENVKFWYGPAPPPPPLARRLPPSLVKVWREERGYVLEMLTGYPDQAPAQPLPEPLADVPLSMRSVIDVFVGLVGQVSASQFLNRWSEGWAVESSSLYILGMAFTIFGTCMVSGRFAKSPVQALVDKKSNLPSLNSSPASDIVVIEGQTRSELLADRDEPLLDEGVQVPVVTEAPHAEELPPVLGSSPDTDWSAQVPFIFSSTPVRPSLDLGLQDFSFGGLIDASQRVPDIVGDVNGAYHDSGVLTESISSFSLAVREEEQLEFLGEGPSLASIGSSEFGSALVENLDYGVPIPSTTDLADWTEESPELLAVAADHPFGDEPADMDWAGLAWTDTSSLHCLSGLSDVLGRPQDQDITSPCDLSNLAVATEDFGPSVPDDEGDAIPPTELNAILEVVGLSRPSENPAPTVDQDAVTLTKTMAIGNCCEIQISPSFSLPQGQLEDKETATHGLFVDELVDVAVAFSRTEDANLTYSETIEKMEDVVTCPCTPSHMIITSAELACSLADTEGPTVTGPGTSSNCFEHSQPLCALEVLDSAEDATASTQTTSSTANQFDSQNLLLPTSILYESEGLLIQSHDENVHPPSLFADEWKKLAKLGDYTNCQRSIDDNITLPFSMFWKQVQKSTSEGASVNTVCNLAQDDDVAVFDVDRLLEQVTPTPSDSCNSTQATPEAGPGPSAQGQGNDQDVEEAFPSFDFLQQIPEDMEELLAGVLEEPAELILFPSELEEYFMPYSSTEKTNISGLALSPLGNPQDSINDPPNAMNHNVKKSSTRYGISQWEERLRVRKSVADLWQPRGDIQDASGSNLSLDDASMLVHGKEDLSQDDISQDCFFAGHLVEDFNDIYDISMQKSKSVKDLPPSELKNVETRTSYAFLWQALPTTPPVASTSEKDDLDDASMEVLGRDSSYEEDISQAFLSDSSFRDLGNRSITTHGTTPDPDDSAMDQSIISNGHMGASLDEEESMDITDLLLYTGPVSDAIGDITYSLMPGEDKSEDWGFLDAMQEEWEAEHQY